MKLSYPPLRIDGDEKHLPKNRYTLSILIQWRENTKKVVSNSAYILEKLQHIFVTCHTIETRLSAGEEHFSENMELAQKGVNSVWCQKAQHGIVVLTKEPLTVQK